MGRNDKALRNVSHAIWLQIFAGAGFIVLSTAEARHPEFMLKPLAVGGMLIFLGMNSMLYLDKYRKGLKEAR